MRAPRLAVVTGLVAFAGLMTVGILPAQDSPADRFFRVLDQNANGQVDPDEWDGVPPMKAYVESQGTPLDRPMSREDFTRLQEEFSEQIRSGQGSRPQEEQPMGGDANPGADRPREEAAAPVSPQAAAPARTTSRALRLPARNRPPIVISLPADYKARDKNGDGQIGLYELARSDLKNFRKLDLNGDGFLTPVELVRVAGPQGAVTTVAGSPAGGPPGPGGPPSPRSPGQPNLMLTDPAAGRAEYTFNLLDRNKDGSINPDEFASSRIIRPQFEKASIDISKTMSKSEFIETFKKINAPKP